MDFRFTPEEEQFRQEVREFIKKEWPHEFSFQSVAEVGGHEDFEAVKQFTKKLADRGWLTMSWPKEYGGQASDPMEQFIFAEEMSYFGAQASVGGVRLVGPTIMMYGTEEQKREWLPKIARGEVETCLGYTEPNAGSDLASLQIKAVEDGDDYVINGQKMFTSGAHRATHVWLAARTDQNVPKHKGISMFLVPIDTPGITVRPLWTMANYRTNEVFYDNVRVPRKNLIGEPNRGWYYLATALDFERVAAWSMSGIRHVLEELVKFAKETEYDGKPLSENPEVREMLAQISIEVEVGTMLNYRLASMVSKGLVPNYEASMSKLFGTESIQRSVNAVLNVLGLYGQLAEGSKYAPLMGRLERLHRAAVMPTIGAGTSEIQRNIIATRGLGLPR